MWIWGIAAERIDNTVKWFPRYVKMLRTSSADCASTAEAELTDVLRNPAPEALFAPIGNEQAAALQQLYRIFTR